MGGVFRYTRKGAIEQTLQRRELAPNKGTTSDGTHGRSSVSGSGSKDGGTLERDGSNTRRSVFTSVQPLHKQVIPRPDTALSQQHIHDPWRHPQHNPPAMRQKRKRAKKQASSYLQTLATQASASLGHLVQVGRAPAKRQRLGQGMM